MCLVCSESVNIYHSNATLQSNDFGTSRQTKPQQENKIYIIWLWNVCGVCQRFHLHSIV